MKKYRKSKIKPIKEDFDTIELEQGGLIVSFGLPSCKLVWIWGDKVNKQLEHLT